MMMLGNVHWALGRDEDEDIVVMPLFALMSGPSSGTFPSSGLSD